jgi:topoisomerase-4 subunit B
VLEVEVALRRQPLQQTFARGVPTSKLKDLGEVHNRRGTRIRFKPDPQIFKGGLSSTPSACSDVARSRPISSAVLKSAGRPRLNS